MLRIAVPNKGSLAAPAEQLLREAGYATRRDGRELVLEDHENDVELYFLRPRDIAVYVGSGTLDVGITGRDLLLDSRAPADEVIELGFGPSTFRFAGPLGTAAASGAAFDLAALAGRRVATSYPALVEDHLLAAGVVAEVVRLDGAVETAVRLGVADVIADVVETGRTLRAAGLELLGEPILRSAAVLVRRRDAEGAAGPLGLDVLVRRIEGVLVARRYVMVDYDVRREHLEAATRITPGLESPTISPLQDPAWAAVRAMVDAVGVNRVMDELYDLGARAILVTSIHACRI